MQQNSKNNIEVILNELQLQKKTSKNWNITWQQGVFLSNLVLIKKPKSILEIGTSNGFSTLWLAKELDSNSNLITIEVDEKRYLEAKKNFDLANLKNITVLNGEVFEILDKYKFENSFDLIFIDAVQKFYFELLDKLLGLNLINKNTTIIFDNVLSHEYMKDFIKKIEKKYSCDKLDLGGGGFLVVRNFF